ncbi:MAG: ammonium transporter, partial [Vicinamibacterales bacterium]
AVGLFATDGGLFFGGGIAKLMTQLTGVAAVGVAVFGLSAITWLILKTTIGIRVSAEEEVEGLDVGEHGMEAYPGFTPTKEARAEVI